MTWFEESLPINACHIYTVNHSTRYSLLTRVLRQMYFDDPSSLHSSTRNVNTSMKGKVEGNELCHWRHKFRCVTKASCNTSMELQGLLSNINVISYNYFFYNGEKKQKIKDRNLVYNREDQLCWIFMLILGTQTIYRSNILFISDKGCPAIHGNTWLCTAKIYSLYTV